MTREKVRLGIVGIGNMGSVHVKHVLDLANTELAALCDNREEKLAKANREAQVPVFTDFEQMLDSVELDGVIIATPHYDHPDMSIAAFQRGINVLVEKPIAVHIGEAQRMIDAYCSAKRSSPDLVFAAMFMQRTWGHWRKIKAMIDSGDLGKLQRCTWIITDWFRTQYYYDSGDWRASWSGEGGGVLMNQCPHNLDLYQWLVGMPASIHGFVNFGKHHRIEVEDEVTAYFKYANGMVGHFITTTGESPGSNRLEIVGENGMLVYSAPIKAARQAPIARAAPTAAGVNGQSGELVFFRNERSSIAEIRDSDKGFEKVPCTREVVSYDHHGKQGHEIVIENFANTILGGETLIAPAEEGLNSITLNNGIILSAHKRQTIDLPIDAREFSDLLAQYVAHPPV